MFRATVLILLALSASLSGCTAPEEPAPVLDEGPASPAPWTLAVDSAGAPPGLNACTAGSCATGSGNGVVVSETLNTSQRLEEVHLRLTDPWDGTFPTDLHFVAIYQAEARGEPTVIGEAAGLPSTLDLDGLDLPPGGSFRVEVSNDSPTAPLLISAFQGARAKGTLSGHEDPAD